MIFTDFGIVYSVLILFFAFTQSTRRLFFLFIFVIPLGYIKILFLPFIGTKLSIDQVTSLLLIVKVLTTQKRVSNRTKTWPIILFLFIVFITLFIPIIFAGDINVVSMSTSYEYYTFDKLSFSIDNITQIVLLIWTITVFYVMVSRINNINDIKKIIKVNFISVYVVLISGFIYQLLLMFDQRSIMDQFFRIFTGEETTREFEFVFGILPRMFSFAGEPGDTALYLIMILSVSLYFKLFFKDFIKIPNYFIFLLILSILLTGGTTGLVGLITIIISLFFINAFSPQLVSPLNRSILANFTKTMFVLLITSLGIIFIFTEIFNINVIEYIYYTHILKFYGEGEIAGSGQFRLYTADIALDIFNKFPFLGVGYGSHRTPTMVMTFLSNIGLIGISGFLFYNYYYLKRIFLKRIIINQELRVVATAVGVAHISILIPMLVGTGIHAFHNYYYWLLIAIEIIIIYKIILDKK